MQTVCFLHPAAIAETKAAATATQQIVSCI